MNINAGFRRISIPYWQKRMRAFEQCFLSRPVIVVLDVGDTSGIWHLLDSVPNVVLLGNYLYMDCAGPRFTFIQGDGCDMAFSDKDFDMVFSNPVITHLATWGRQVAYANEVRRAGQGCFVQSPNRWLPVQLHYPTPFVHFRPSRLRVQIDRICAVYGAVTILKLAGSRVARFSGSYPLGFPTVGRQAWNGRGAWPSRMSQ